MKILITLGHNSSVIALNNDGSMIAGYEEERLTRVKSDKNFPINALNKVLEYCKPNDNNELFISHWYDDFDFHTKQNIKKERYDYDVIEKLKAEYGFHIKTLSEEFTHHDAHAYSVKAFYNYHVQNYIYSDIHSHKHIIVADGFGNKQEVISVYSILYGNIKLIKRYYGYGKSLGLMYQYATSYCGMKENEDEYKFLGYESHIKDILSYSFLNNFLSFINNFINEYWNNINSKNVVDANDTYINLDDLEKIRSEWKKCFGGVVTTFSPSRDEFTIRVIIANFIQNVIEGILEKIIHEFNITDVLLAGGIFYNVKLNASIRELVDSICVMPIAGDQGAAIGLYESYYRNFSKNFNTLCWGKRDLNDTVINAPDYTMVLKDKDYFITLCTQLLLRDEIVQIVHGDMEFGPRALCHTSTLALPTKENVSIINQLNKRNDTMPMAPVIKYENASYFFDCLDIGKVIGSLQFMIMTLDYRRDIINNEFDKYSGMMHNYPLNLAYSGRPQLIRDKTSIIYQILDGIESVSKALINTSYNVHGKPIVYTAEDAIDDFQFQMKQKEENKITKNIYLLIYSGE